MKKSSAIVRKNIRNISRKIEVNGQSIFLKQSLDGSSNCANEYYFWEKFYSLGLDIVPKCLSFDHNKKTITFEWLEDYFSITKKFSLDYIKTLLNFLRVNYCENNYNDLKNNKHLMLIANANKDKQIRFFSDLRCSAEVFLKKYLKSDEINDSFLMFKKFFLKKECLCHGDLGRNNILVCNKSLKIVDFEYSLISCREFDYGRIISSLLLSFSEGNISKEFFRESIELITNEDLSFTALSLCSGWQLLYRIIGEEHKQLIPTCMKLLMAFKQIECYDFKSFFA